MCYGENKGGFVFCLLSLHRKTNSMYCIWEIMIMPHGVPLKLPSWSCKSDRCCKDLMFVIFNKISDIFSSLVAICQIIFSCNRFAIELCLLSPVFVRTHLFYFHQKTNPSPNSCFGNSQKQTHPSDKPAASCNHTVFM